MDFRFSHRWKFIFLFFGLLFFSQLTYGQLSNFTLQLTATNETCTANGSLAFQAQNTEPGAIIIYRIFKLPDTVAPIAVTSTNSLGGLVAGSYRVVAIQSLGSLSNTQQQDIAITNLIVPITFQISSQPATYCGATATLSVSVQQGTPATYEIISGPLLVPPQTSNIFSGLPPGDYDVRVNDACGDGVVQTYHLAAPPPNLSLQLNQFCLLENCSTKNLDVRISAAGATAIGYPLQIQLTLAAQGFPTVVFNQTITTGAAGQNIAGFTIPYHNVSPYTASVRVVDACGNVYLLNNSPLQMTPEVNLVTDSINDCAQFINIGLCNLLPPYSVSFLEAPAGFNPALFNPGNLGPFTESSILYSSTAQDKLPEGHYVIQVTDACGNIATGSANITNKNTDHKLISRYEGCELVYEVTIPDAGLAPVTVVLTSAPAGYPGTLPQDLSSTISGGIFHMNLPLQGTYVFTGVNVCRETYIRTVTTIPPDPRVTAVGNNIPGCSTGSGRVTIAMQGGPPMVMIIMTAAPPEFNQPLPYNVSPWLVSATEFTVYNLVLGTYTFVVTDACGTVYPPVTATVSPGALTDTPTVEFLRGCEDGYGSMKMKSANDKLVQVIITAAPAGFPHTLPYEVSFNINPLGVFYMNTLIEGQYTFYTKDLCGAESTTNITVPGTEVISNYVNIVGNCGSFNITLVHYASPPFIQTFWLQKFNPNTNQWGHPYSGVVYTEGTVPNTGNSYRVHNSITNYNIASLGSFRILKYSNIYSNGVAAYSNCYSVIKEFVYTGELKIESTSAVSCNNSSYEVLIGVSGIAPFIYRITTKDGQPFAVNNGNSNIFTGLAPGIYNFQVEDSCGNIVNRLLDITTLTEPAIYPNNLCDGVNGQLSVPAVSFLSYQWWNANAPGTILSTSSTLNFAPFSNTTSPGTYFVRIYSTTNLSCIDMTISYTVSPSVIPNAGLDATRTICGSTTPVDLFTILGAPFDTGGTWTEVTNSNALSGSTWSPAGVVYGVYIFNYYANSLCGTPDVATVTLHYNPIPADPVASADPGFCNDDTIALSVDAIPGATYHWTGPNGFVSDVQNPTISNATSANSGTYTITANLNGCESTATVEVALIPSPDYVVEQGCVGGIFTLSVKPKNNSFDNSDVTYSWTGPGNFNSSQNPVQLNGASAGIYQVAVTNNSGCATNKSTTVTSTLCSIPNVVTPNGDGFNQYFDLSGMDVKRLEIYSRWGRLVYEANNYIDEWYGQNMSGKELPDSTYYYIIFLGNGQEKQGWVYKTPWQ